MRLAIVTIPLLLAPSLVFAATIHVPTDQPTIQAGITAASSGDTVELADGTYTGNGNRDVDFLGKAITVRSQYGNPATCIIDCEASAGDPHRGFFFQSGEGPNSVLEGVTITGGRNPVAWPVAGGGGIACNGVSPTIRDCLITHNTGDPDGGGMFSWESSPTLVGCTFLENDVANPGTGGHGGGLFCGNSGTVVLIGCAFSGNYASHGGGISSELVSLTGSDCVLSGNIADGFGGGIHMSDWMAVENSTTFTDCTFDGNTAQSGGAFHGLFDYELPPAVLEFDRCVFSENIANGGGALTIEYGCSLHMTDCLLRGNEATQNNAGALYLDEVGGTTVEAILTGCTFWDNQALLDGGAIYDIRSNLTVDRCTFHENSARDGGALLLAEYSNTNVHHSIFGFSTAGDGIHCSDYYGPVEITISCSNVHGNFGGDWIGCISDQLGVDGNISLPPQYCGVSGSGNFYLQSDSPCAPGNHPDGEDCGLIGALPVNCGNTATQATSWSQVKTLY